MNYHYVKHIRGNKDNSQEIIIQKMDFYFHLDEKELDIWILELYLEL